MIFGKKWFSTLTTEVELIDLEISKDTPQGIRFVFSCMLVQMLNGTLKLIIFYLLLQENIVPFKFVPTPPSL